MTDLTPILNELLRGHDAPPTAKPSLTLETIDEFVKEAYRINSHIASLNRYLHGIRQPYLSTAAPPRRGLGSSRDKNGTYLTDRQREEIDAETKQVLRQLNAGIRNLADAEHIRQETVRTVTRKTYERQGLGALGSWAAGGLDRRKTYEQELDEARAQVASTHRESVLWYLRQKLQACGSLQAGMMEKRIMREVEKSRSVLAKSRSAALPQMGAPSAPIETAESGRQEEDELSAEQVQMFEAQNQEMLKHYESTLDQVRMAEKSLVEISELQSQLVSNLATQSAHIDQLVENAELITDNVGGGNRELKRATERTSTAKYVFYASCGLSVFLISWDMIF